jgi:hypothetical protein
VAAHHKSPGDGTFLVTLDQLGQRVHELERQVAELRGELRALRPLRSVGETFGMFAGDPEFSDVVRLGREYRDQVNAEDS